MQFDRKYEKQMISIDVSIFSIIEDELKVLLVKRAVEPYANMWSLLGGGVYNDETCETAVKRELKEKIDIVCSMPILSGVFSEPNRDIRFRNISVAYYCFVKENENIDLNKSKVTEAKWFSINEVPTLAFDHKDILVASLTSLRTRVYDIDFMKEFLPKTFTLKSLQKIYESILDASLDKRNFRRKIASLDCLINTGVKNELDKHKKSDIYKFK